MKLTLRGWLTSNLLKQWLQPATAYRLGMVADNAVNPDQRIQEDVKNFTESSSDLGIGLLQSVMLLLTFVGVLWSMSSQVRLDFLGLPFNIPGYMVWAALSFALVGSWLATRVGRPLVSMNEERYAREADLRFSLVRVSESAEGIAFYSGEKGEHRALEGDVDRVLKIMGQYSFGLARLTWITSGYGWLMIVVPALIALPGYMQGTLNFGGLMMVVGAFNQVQGSLQWLINNYARIADWRAALHRVSVFSQAMEDLGEYHANAEQIESSLHPEGLLSFEGAQVHLVGGGVVIADATATIGRGERVLLTGESGTGKSTLFRAVGGLWPWGAGTIAHPPRDEMMFLPQKPYMPLGTLAEALAYPKVGPQLEESVLRAALMRVNLSEFIPQLHQLERWDKLMSLGQQQRLAFARLLLHKPQWVFLDEATSALDDANQDLMMELFERELKSSSVLSIAHRPGLAKYHSRTLHLVSSEEGAVLRRFACVETKARVSVAARSKRAIVAKAKSAGAKAKSAGALAKSAGRLLKPSLAKK
jgi:putative ATP-binding cassette transporter